MCTEIIMEQTIPLLCKNQEDVSAIIADGFKLVSGDLRYLCKIPQPNMFQKVAKFMKLHV